jgi:hypothetical protein
VLADIVDAVCDAFNITVVRREQLVNADHPIDVHAGKLTVVRLEQS